MTHLTDIDQAPYSTPVPQTATVSDEAVQAALDKCENVDWVQGLVGTGLSGREVIESALTAALPHLAISASPCSVEVKKLEWEETSYGMPEVFTEVGVYRINNAHDGGWSLNRNNKAIADHDGRRNFADQQNVKAAAQADFERRILSCVVTKPVELLDEASLQAKILEIGNQIHNLGCEHQNNEALKDRLQDLRDQLWGMAKDAATPVDVAAVRRQALEALKKAEQFIENGVEFGFIKLPDSDDPALETLPTIKEAIRALSAETSPEAGQ